MSLTRITYYLHSFIRKVYFSLFFSAVLKRIVVPIFQFRSKNISLKSTFKRPYIKIFQLEDSRNVFQYLPKEQTLIPNTQIYDKKFAISDWVTGCNLRDISLNERVKLVATLLSQLHQLPIPKIDFERKFFFFEWLSNELEVNLKKIPQKYTSMVKKQIIFIRKNLDAENGFQLSFVNPDLNTPNIIETSDGRYCCIDNEYLSVGICKEYDVFATMNTFPPELSNIFLDEYGQYIALDIYRKCIHIWTVVHKLKKINFLMRTGALKKAIVLIKDL